jgi:hypothetical protein
VTGTASATVTVAVTVIVAATVAVIVAATVAVIVAATVAVIVAATVAVAVVGDGTAACSYFRVGPRAGEDRPSRRKTLMALIVHQVAVETIAAVPVRRPWRSSLVPGKPGTAAATP